MALAWHSVGLASRTALDAGLNRSVDKWQVGAGATVYIPEEKESCRRVWHAVMLMDKYVPRLVLFTILFQCIHDDLWDLFTTAILPHTLVGH
jgi:hypothetical protein